MFTKAVALFALIAAAQAGVQYIDQHVGAQSEQTIRGLGFAGLSTISSQQKAVDSAFSSVRKHDTRVINPAVSVAAAPVAYAQPAYAHAGQVAYAQPAYAHNVAYGPAVAAAPVARVAAPVAYAAPVAKAVAAPASLLGVAYSSVPQVAHLNFDGFGVHYGY